MEHHSIHQSNMYSPSGCVHVYVCMCVCVCAHVCFKRSLFFHLCNQGFLSSSEFLMQFRSQVMAQGILSWGFEGGAVLTLQRPFHKDLNAASPASYPIFHFHNSSSCVQTLVLS